MKLKFMIKCECQTIVLFFIFVGPLKQFCCFFLKGLQLCFVFFYVFIFMFLFSCFLFLTYLYFLFSFRQDSNVNIIRFCKLKDGVIEKEYSIAEEAKESYKSLLNENLDNEKKLRERK